MDQAKVDIGNLFNFVDTVRRRFADAANSVLTTVQARFEISLLRNCRQFAELCGKYKTDPESTVLPCPCDFDSIRDFLHDNEPETLKSLKDFVVNNQAAIQFRDFLRAWKPELLPDFHLAKTFNLFQVKFIELLYLSEANPGPAPSVAYKTAFLKGSGGLASGFVHEGIVKGVEELKGILMDMHTCNLNLHHRKCPDKTKHLSNRTLFPKATDAFNLLTDSFAKKWSLVLDKSVAAMSQFFPKGDWMEKAVDSRDEEYIEKSLLGNPEHLKLAQIAEWLERATKCVADACVKLSREKAWHEEFADVNEKVTNVVRDVRTVVMAAAVYQLIKRGDIEAPSRAAAVSELRLALKATGVKEVPAQLETCLVTFAAAGGDA